MSLKIFEGGWIEPPISLHVQKIAARDLNEHNTFSASWGLSSRILLYRSHLSERLCSTSITNSTLSICISTVNRFLCFYKPKQLSCSLTKSRGAQRNLQGFWSLSVSTVLQQVRLTITGSQFILIDGRSLNFYKLVTSSVHKQTNVCM